MTKKIVFISFVIIFTFTLTILAIAEEKKTAFSMRDWMEKDNGFKTKLVNEFISVAKKNGVLIRLPVEYYVKEIDLLIQNSINNGNEHALDNSWAISFKTIAAMEGDWDNGKDKLLFAQELMGSELFKQFIKMYPDKYEKLFKQSKDINK
ncbi:MAG: hypothetical protein GX654_19685 [Desulfatiglans sp.]|nr:hypothetical protein [Desulfatiglans sp.]